MTENAAPIPAAATCIPNIGPRGRRFRYIFGALALAVALGGAVRVALLRMPPVAMAGPALAFFAAALGFFQAREKTCIFLAAIGEHDEDAGGPARRTQEHLVLIRRQVWRVVLRTLVAGSALSAVAFAVSFWRAR